MSVLEEKAQCALMEAAKRLKPERLAEPISPAEHRRTEGGSVRSKEAAERLKVERFGEKSTVCSFRKKSRPEHRSIPKG